jgi:N-acetylglucosamine-6-sulfatase
MTRTSPKRTILGAAALAVALLGWALLGGAPQPAGAAKAKKEKQPNIVVVMTDDQTVESMRVMPKAEKLLADKGVTFTNSFASNPICCPSRATFMSGQYSHTNGVFRNDGANGGFSTLNAAETLPVWLQRAGYSTAHVGKFLNGYGEGNGAAAVPPGWTEWYGTEDPTTYRMYGYELNENGNLNTYGDYDVPDPALYQTDLLAGKATDFINRRAPQEAPFFLSVAPLAPHVEVFRRDPGDDDPPTPNYPNPRPAPRHIDALANENLPKKGAFNEANVNDKPEAIRNMPPLDGPAIGQARNKYRSRLTSLLAVDDMVGNLVKSLRANGELNRTLIVFTSDNGFLLGEHRIRTGKQYPYEPSVRVPLLMRGPGIPKGEDRDQLVANVDLAPTLADFGRAATGLPPDGRSVRRLIKEPDLEPGRAIVLENWCQTNEPACFDPEIPRYRGVRTNRFKYLEYPNGEREMYDLDRDPDEMKSLQDKTKYDAEQAALHGLLTRLQTCAGGACRISPRLKLKLSYDRGRLGGGKRCTDSPVTATIGGRDKGAATDGTFSVPGEDRTDDKRPLRVRIPKRDLKGGRVTPVTAEAYVLDGRLVSLEGNVPRAC